MMDDSTKPVRTIDKIASDITDSVKGFAAQSTKKAVEVIDMNGNGQIDIEDVIILGLRSPGIGIDREAFLKKEFLKNYSPETINKAIETTPAKAGIPIADVDKISDQVIQFERTCVSGISALLSAPGGLAMIATLPADIIQYYGYMLRTTQKLMYLYGFPQIDVSSTQQIFDSETLNILTLCMGVMYGVAGAQKAISSIAKALSIGVEKQLIKKALTSTAIYPIVKSIAKWFSIRMTKQVFAGFFRKAIPVVGGVIGGSLTYIAFKPCCNKLKDALRNTPLSNPELATNEDKEVDWNEPIEIYEDVQIDETDIIKESTDSIDSKDE